MEGALVKPPAYAKTWLEISLPPSEFAYCIIERLCARGELICWARLGSPDGAWIEFPSEAWEVPNPHPLSIQQPGELRIEPVVPPLEPRDDRILGTVERYKLDEKRVRRRNPQTGRTEYVIEEVKIYERWYNPVFAPATLEGGKISRPTALQAFADWCEWERQHDPEDRWPGRPKCRAVGKSLGLRQKDYDHRPTPSKKGRHQKLAKK